MPPTIWISGATSTTGSYLLPLLLARGCAVHALSRQDPAPLARVWPAVDWQHAGLDQAPGPVADVQTLISLGPLDAFVDWLARVDARPALRAAIALSSTSVITKADSASSAERALAQQLALSEQRFAQLCARLGLAGTLLRPTLIYGGQQDLVARLARWGQRWHVYPHLLGSAGRALRQPVHAQDLADAVLAALDRPATGVRALNLPGAEVLSLRELIARSARARTRWALPIPLTAGMLLGRALAARAHHAAALGPDSLGRLQRDQIFDLAPARATLGFNPRAFRP